MNKPDFFAHAASFAPGFFQARRRTWMGVGIGLLVLFALLIWAVVALVSWLWGQTQNLADAAPDVLQGTARSVLEQVKGVVSDAQGGLDQVKESIPGAQGVVDQVKKSVPDARERLSGLVPALKPETPPRDVSGEDLGPVPRYAGFLRTHWQRIDGLASVGYEGKADYVKVLDYYSEGFVAKGFSQKVLSAATDSETHEYTKDSERFLLKVAQKSRNLVSIHIETRQKSE